jgi:hypothetical protein
LRAKLGELLVKAGVLTSAQVDRALEKQQTLPHHPKLGEVIVAMGLVSEAALLEVLANLLHLPAIDLATVKPQKPALAAASEAEAKRSLMLPLKIEVVGQRRRLLVAMADPTNVQAIDELQFKSGMVVQPVVATLTQIRRAIPYYYERGGTGPLPSDGPAVVPQGEDMRVRPREETWVGQGPATAAPVIERRDIAELHFLKGKASGKVVHLKVGQSLVFGRGEQADIYVPDMRMSRKHFLIVDSGTGIEIVDLGSRNGINVNQRATKRAVLKSEDYIEAGDTLMQVTLLPRY